MNYTEDLFQEFLLNRAEIAKKKSINTDRAVKALRKKLDGWAVMGYPCNRILNHAIEVGWRGLFLPQGIEPKQKHLKAPKQALDLVDQIKHNTRVKQPPTASQKQVHADSVRNQANAMLAIVGSKRRR